MTTFIAGLSNSTVRWEVRKAKPAGAEAALQAAMETHSSLEIDGSKLQTSGVNNISTESPLDTLLSYFVVSAQKFKTQWLSHHVPTEVLPKTIKDIVQAVEIVTDIGLPHQDRDSITTFSNLKNPVNPTSGTPPETATVRGITPKFASQITPKITNETDVPVRSVGMKKNANLLDKTTIPAISAKHVSIVAKLVKLRTNAAPDAKI